MATNMSAAVERGAVLLDEKRPGWEHELDLARLKLENCTDCVLGQLAGHYADGVIALDLERPWEYGFAVDPINPPHRQAYADLTGLWIRKIAERRR